MGSICSDFLCIRSQTQQRTLTSWKQRKHLPVARNSRANYHHGFLRSYKARSVLRMSDPLGVFPPFRLEKRAGRQTFQQPRIGSIQFLCRQSSKLCSCRRRRGSTQTRESSRHGRYSRMEASCSATYITETLRQPQRTGSCHSHALHATPTSFGSSWNGTSRIIQNFYIAIYSETVQSRFSLDHLDGPRAWVQRQASFDRSC